MCLRICENEFQRLEQLNYVKKKIAFALSPVKSHWMVMSAATICTVDIRVTRVGMRNQVGIVIQNKVMSSYI